jgi:hypothetical protein
LLTEEFLLANLTVKIVKEENDVSRDEARDEEEEKNEEKGKKTEEKPKRQIEAPIGDMIE